MDQQVGSREATIQPQPVAAGTASSTLDRAAPLADRQAPKAAPRPRQQRPTLVVVDDEAEVLRSVHDLLRIEYRVVTCQSGREAVDYLRSAEEVHVILSDQRMPGMSGVEVLEQARALRPETTRLLFTAFTDLRTVIDAINQGHIFRYIAKPWDPQELEAIVRQAVGHHDLIVEKNRLLVELQETNAKLVEANRLKGAFLEVASHELNTPVTIVLGLTHLWSMSLGKNATGPERQWVERISAAAQRLAGTVDRMLKLIKNEEFGHTLDLEEVDLSELLRETVATVSPYLETRGQNIEVRVEPGLPLVQADRSKLSDVLINLVANAIKFTPDQGTIRIEAQIDPENADRVRVAVSDEGLGVHPSDQQHLFEPFFTGFDTLHHSSGDFQFRKRGIGLGLCLVKTFVELHGGQVDCLSTPGNGSTFAFSLPRRHKAVRGKEMANVTPSGVD